MLPPSMLGRGWFHHWGWIAISGAICLVAARPLRGHADIEVLIADLDRRIAEAPSDPALYLRRGELRRLHCEWTLALNDYQRARDFDPELAVVDLCLGKILAEAGLWSPALLVLDRYLAERPLEAEGFAARARVRWKLGDPDGAARDFARAIAVYPASRLPPPELYLDGARSLAAAGRPDAALRILDEGLARLGSPITLVLSALQLELDGKRYPQALARLDEAAKGSARKEHWLLRRGRILEDAGRAEEAREAYREVLAAVEKSTAFRRQNRATQRLEAEARESLERLSTGGRGESKGK